MSRIQSWEVSNSFWQRVEPLIPQPTRTSEKSYRRRAGGGRKPKDYRLVFEAIVYVLRTGIQWKALPMERFGSASAIHTYFIKWQRQGFFERLWQAGLAEYDDMEGIAWRWQSVDSASIKAPLARETSGPNSTDRGKKRKQTTHSGGRTWRPAVTHRNRSQSARHNRSAEPSE